MLFYFSYCCIIRLGELGPSARIDRPFILAAVTAAQQQIKRSYFSRTTGERKSYCVSIFLSLPTFPCGCVYRLGLGDDVTQHER
jgi:hypothetical protein